jgi:hypothetical protein
MAFSTKFKLHVDPVKIDKDFKTMERGVSYNGFNPMVTKLEDLGINDEKISDSIFSTFNDENYVSYYPDYVNSKKYPSITNIPCFYCTEPFTTKPIGIPISYVASYYKSHIISKVDHSKLTVHVTLYTKKELKKAEERKEDIVYQDYYITEGNFCSFHCMLAYLGKNKSEVTNETMPLIKQMFYDSNGHNVEFITESAPDIRLLKKFGGHLSINEFRSSEGRKYIKTRNMSTFEYSEMERPDLCVPISYLYRYSGTKL